MIIKPKLILIGGSGHCKSCIDVIESEDKYTIEGILDVPGKVGQEILGYPIIGTDDKIPLLVQQGFSFLITVGQINNAKTRINIYNILKKLNVSLPVIAAASAVVSKHANVKEGTIIMHQTIINAGANIGENCIINNKSLIEHDVLVGAHTHVSTNTIINGACIVGERNFIGSNVVIIQGVFITNDVVIGAGAVVTKNIEESGVYVGSPAKRIK